MPKPSKIDRMLTPEDQAEAIRRLKSLRYTIDEIHDWLLSKGYRVSRSAIGRKALAVREDQASIHRMLKRIERKLDRLIGGTSGARPVDGRSNMIR